MINGGGAVPAGGGKIHTFRGAHTALTVRITNPPPLRFAPSVETLRLDYTVVDASSQATAAQLEIADRAGTVVAVVTGIAFAAGAQSAVWDGMINRGPDNGQWIGPTASPLRVRVMVNPGAAHAANSHRVHVAVQVHSVTVTHTPSAAATPKRIYKPSNAAVDTDQELVATVLLRNAVGAGVATHVPIRVDWSFEDRPANCPRAKGGKDNTSTHFLGAVGFPAAGNMLTAANTSTDVNGVTRVLFRASVVAGDKFVVRASVLRAPGGALLAHHDSVLFEVWKQLHYTSLFRMQTGADSGVDVDTLCSVGNIQPAYTPAFTEYDKGAAAIIGYQEHVSPLGLPTPARQAAKRKVRVVSDGADTRQVTVTGLLVNADGSTTAGNEVLTLNGTVEATGLSDFQKVARIDVAADPARTLTVKEDGGAARTIATVAPAHHHATPNFLFDTVASVQTKAQGWFADNETKIGNDLVAFSGTLAAPSFHMAGCAFYHPKYDSGHSPHTTFYAGYPTARITVGVAPNTRHVHPDQAWGGVDGVNQGHLSCVFKNMDPGNQVVVARHEIGHSCDHLRYDAGPGDDHCPRSKTTCLMNWESEHLLFCTAGHDHSLRKTQGWDPR